MPHPNDQLTQWAEFLHTRAAGLSYARESPLHRIAHDAYSEPVFGSRLPPGILTPGLRAFLRVEAVLVELGDAHRLVAAVEHGVIRPQGESVKTQQDRAHFAECSRETYRVRLNRIREGLQQAEKTPPKRGCGE